MPQAQKSETLRIAAAGDIVVVRQKVRSWAVEQGFSIIDQTKIVTAASELARNTLDYGKGGICHLEAMTEGLKKGLRLSFEDKGPGIADIELALTDGYTTGGGLGMGLSGSRRLVNEFSIQSRLGEGTQVVITKWK